MMAFSMFVVQVRLLGASNHIPTFAILHLTPGLDSQFNFLEDWSYLACHVKIYT